MGNKASEPFGTSTKVSAVAENQLEGVVSELSSSGSLICDITESQLENVPRDQSLTVQFAGHETVGLYAAEHDEPMGTLVAKLNSDGFLEIEIVGISASEMLGVKASETVTLKW